MTHDCSKAQNWSRDAQILGVLMQKRADSSAMRKVNVHIVIRVAYILIAS